MFEQLEELNELADYSTLQTEKFESGEAYGEFLQTNFNENTIKILHLNIRSVHHNIDEFLLLMESIKTPIDLILLGETWGCKWHVLDIPGYVLHFSGSNINKADGLIMYIRNNIPHSVTHIISNEFTFSHLKFKIDNTNFKIVATYRPPSTSIPTFIKSLHDNLTDNENEDITIFLGDININLLDRQNLYTNDYTNTLAGFGFRSSINSPTRVTDITSSCVDHIFIRLKTHLQKIDLYPAIINTSITDHYCTCLNIKLSKNSEKLKHSNNYKTKIDFQKLNNSLSTETWNSITNIDDPIQCTNKFYSLLNNCIKLSETKIKITNKNRKLKPWMTNGLLKSIQTRDKIKKRYLRYKDNLQLKEKFQNYRNTLTNLIKTVKNEYYREKITAANNTRDIWRVLNDVTGTPGRISDVGKIDLNYKNKLLCNNKEKADAFNDFFINVADDLCPETAQQYEHIPPINNNIMDSMFLMPVTESEIIEHIASLKSNSSPGPDNIQPLMIKECHKCLTKPVTHIINSIFKTGIIPIQFKSSVITPIYKNGAESDITNYRPISVINNFAKILEKCMKKRLLQFLERHSVLGEHQFGFRSGLSTQDAAFEVLNKIYDNIDKKQKPLAVFLDLTKAFDLVSHKILLKKLQSLGIRGIVYRLFCNYLFGRSQKVRIKDSLSEVCTVKRGVPQGTVLGPILFLIYIDDMSKNLKVGSMVSYADDTVLLFHGNNWQETIIKAKKGLTGIGGWINKNHLLINYNKTKYIKFSLTPSNLEKEPINLHNCNGKTCTCPAIEQTTSVKYLGVHIDSGLKWDVHADSVCKSLKYLLHKFYILRNVLSRELMITFYKAVIESRLRYCNIVWGGLYNEHQKIVYNTQKHIIKTMLKLKRDHPTDRLFQENKLLSVRGLYILDTLIFTHKRHTFDRISHVVNTRSKAKNLMNTKKCNFSAVQRFICFLGPRLYNQLPNDLQNQNNIKKFKNSAKTYVLSNYLNLEKLLTITV